MIPPYSWAVPGRKPGTSTKVIRGMLKESQKRTKRAPFTEALMSRQPGGERDERNMKTQNILNSILCVSVHKYQKGGLFIYHPNTIYPDYSIFTCSMFGVVSHNSDRPAIHPCKPGDQVLGIERHHLKELALIHNA